MLIFLINSFNTDYYFTKALQLSNNIHNVLNDNIDHRCVIVKGGCSENNYSQYHQYEVHIDITSNLSDHNIYRGFSLFEKLLPDSFDKHTATYIALHDTCLLSESFLKRMKHIETIQFTKSVQWIFGHLFGLYNIGICTYDFVMRRAKDFEGLEYLSKEHSITLEHGEIPNIDGITILPLLAYSTYTLNELHKTNASIEDEIDNVDSYSLSTINNKIPRNFNKISSLGVYKLFTSGVNFKVPIISHRIPNPKTFKDVKSIHSFLRKHFGISFGPFVNYKHIHTTLKTNGLEPIDGQYF